MGPVEPQSLQEPPCCPWLRDRDLVLRKGDVFHVPPMQQPRETKVAFEAARLGIQSVLLVALFGELLLDGPRPRPHGRRAPSGASRDGSTNMYSKPCNTVSIRTRRRCACAARQSSIPSVRSRCGWVRSLNPHRVAPPLALGANHPIQGREYRAPDGSCPQGRALGGRQP